MLFHSGTIPVGNNPLLNDNMTGRIDPVRPIQDLAFYKKG